MLAKDLDYILKITKVQNALIKKQWNSIKSWTAISNGKKIDKKAQEICINLLENLKTQLID